jgi:hypothetical protein
LLSGPVISQADVVLAIEMNELWGTLNAFNDRIVRTSRPVTRKDAKIIMLGTRDLYLKSWCFVRAPTSWSRCCGAARAQGSHRPIVSTQQNMNTSERRKR